MIIAKIKCEYGDAPLDEVQVKVCVNLLQFLSVCFRKENITNVNDFLSKYKVQAIFAPNEYMVLRDCSEMCLDDSDKIEKTSHMIYIHDSIPQKLAQQFGVLSKQLYQLEESSEDVVDFYQDEPLVYRLRRLIDGYPCDTGIFKELIQNADDAATEVVFIKDLDTYRCINVPGENFELLQKPSLCVYNDSSFSKRDLDGIVKLGCGSKWKDPTKTGKFGVGFNSVYNITDAPSFFTKGDEIENGETLCIFDPLAHHIPNVSKEKPGKRYKNMSLVRDSQQDMMLGYHENKFFKDKSYGTVFRLPLRTKPSDIKSEVIDINGISTLLQSFYKELANVMIFLKNIVRVRILTHHEGNYEENCSVEMQMQGNGQQCRKSFSETLSRVHTSFSQQVGDVLKMKQESAEYEIILEQYGNDVDETRSVYYVAQTIGFSEQSEIPETVQKAYERGSILLFPHGGVALCNLEKGAAKGKAFCFLPLPEFTGLPVHVHGTFALDHETRRTLWKSDEFENCYKCQWNIALLKYVVSHSYILLLQRMKRKLFECYADDFVLSENVEKALKLYFSCFPNPSEVHDLYWEKLSEFLHENILQNSLPLLPCLYHTKDGGKEQKTKVKWTAPRVKDGHFLAYNAPEYFLNENFILIKNLRSIGMTVVSVPEFVEKSLKVGESKLKRIIPKHVLEFLLSFDKGLKGGCTVCTGACVSETSFETIEGVQAVFVFCIKDEISFFSNINELPLMLTQDGILNCMKSTESFFVTNFPDLFPSQLNQFLHKRLAQQVLNVHDKDMNDFVKLSRGRLKRFTLSDFVEFVNTVGQKCLLAKPYIQWTKTEIEKEFISTFWDFFREQAQRQDAEEMDENTSRSGHISTQAAVTHCLNRIGSLALLPAYEENTQERLLVSVDEIYRLIDTDSFTQGSKLHEAVVKLNLLQLDKTAFACPRFKAISPSAEVVLKHVSNFQQPEMVLRCLCINAPNIKRLQMTHDDADVLLKYIQNNIKLFKNETSCDSIKKLPIFKTQTYEITDIFKAKNVFVVPKGLPTQGLKEVSTKKNFILLQDMDLTDLYQFLNIKTLATDQVYLEVIFPNIRYLTQPQVFIHIDFICRSILSKEIPDETPILNVLIDLPFVDTGKGRRMCVKDLFYDSPARYKRHHDSGFFGTMCEKSEMLPSQLQEIHHIEIFKRLGLQYEMSAGLFERFAKEIETEGLISITLRVRQRSNMLIKRFFKSRNVEFSSSFTAIKFIVPMTIDTELANIHPQYNREHLISFRKSVSLSKKNMHACWTTSNILPDEADPRNYDKKGLIGRLGILQKPSDEDVFRHCVNIGKSLSQLKIQPSRKLDVAGVIGDIYENLAERLIPSYLKSVPLIYFPDIERIEVASKVVINCTNSQEMPPYLQKSPAVYGKYNSLFKTLGALEQPTVDSYVSILREIQLGSDRIDLMPTTKQTVIKARVNIFHLLKECTSTNPLKCFPLYFLSEDDKLVQANKLVISDNRTLRERLSKGIKLNYMVLPDEGLQIDELSQCLKSLDMCSRPHFLTEIIREEVNTSNMQESDPNVALKIEKFLHGSIFVTGFCRLAKHAMANENKNWTNETKQYIVSSINKIQLTHVKDIETQLVLREDIKHLFAAGVVENTEERKSVHICEESAYTKVYFETTSDKEWFSEISEILVLHLNDLVGGCLKDKLLFTAQKIIKCKDNPGSCEEVLDRKRIDHYIISIKNTRNNAFAKPGTFVPISWHKYLDNDWETINDTDFIIAFKIEDPTLNDKEETNLQNEVTPTYIFVEIIRKVSNNDSQLLQEYEIDIGEETCITTQAFRLYKFMQTAPFSQDPRNALVLTENASVESKGSTGELGFEETCEEIRNALTGVWSKSKTDEERKQVLLRLIFKWHPDKNLDNLEFSTKVFQYIQNCLEELENGGDLQKKKEDKSYTYQTDKQNYSRWFKSHWKTYEHNEKSTFQSEDPRATGPEEFTGEEFKEAEREPYHWYTEAKRWQRQAVSDMENARDCLVQLEDPAYNWVCYKAHQAVEKSLKAAWYAKDANKIHAVKNSHFISSIAEGLSDELVKLANDLSSLTGEHTRMRYPDTMSSPRIPAEYYSKKDAARGVEIAQEILDLVHANFLSSN